MARSQTAILPDLKSLQRLVRERRLRLDLRPPHPPGGGRPARPNRVDFPIPPSASIGCADAGGRSCLSGHGSAPLFGAQIAVVSSQNATEIAPPSPPRSARSDDTKNAPAGCDGAAERAARRIAGARRIRPPGPSLPGGHTASMARTPLRQWGIKIPSPRPLSIFLFSLFTLQVGVSSPFLLSSFASLPRGRLVSCLCSSFSLAFAFAFAFGDHHSRPSSLSLS
jgi:hypothetical protein